MFEAGKKGAVDVITGCEPIIEENLEALAALLEECVGDGQPRIVVDLQQVPLLDSEGLELLVSFQERCQKRGGALALAAPISLCREILSVTGIEDLCEIHDDVTTAVRSFA